MATQEAAATQRRGPVTAAERAEIIDLIEKGDLGCAEIGRRTGRSKATISRIATAEGLTFERSQTKAATEARQADVAARLSQLASDLLDDAQKLRGQLWEPCVVYSFGGKENTYAEHTIGQPDFRAKQAILTSIGIATDKVLAIRKTEQGPSEAAGLIVALVESIRSEHADT